MFNAARPFLLRGFAQHWPACQSWTLRESFSGLLRHDGLEDYHCPIEVTDKGYGYNSSSLRLINMPIGAYLNALIEDDAEENLTAYLAQQRLFDHFPTLQRDLREIGHISNPMKQLWIGPKGTFTPCHYDPDHNLLVQIDGRKDVLLVEDPSGLEMGNGYRSNTAKAQTWSELLEKIGSPGPGDDPSSYKKAHLVQLYPGDALWIPRRLFHAIRSLSTSVSVSHFGDIA